MSFTYDFTSAPAISTVRLLIPDTDSTQPIFSDDEINAFLWLSSSQGIYTSGMAWPNGTQASMPIQIYSYRFAAAYALDSIAGDRSRLASVERILDVKLNPALAAKGLHEIAESLREQERTCGNFAVAELTYDVFTARERTLNQLLRLTGGG